MYLQISQKHRHVYQFIKTSNRNFSWVESDNHIFYLEVGVSGLWKVSTAPGFKKIGFHFKKVPLSGREEAL